MVIWIFLWRIIHLMLRHRSIINLFGITEVYILKIIRWKSEIIGTE
jgi:hypothetical protein